jgi:hypothetical protein
MKTSLFGVRYLMRHWFFTTAILIIGSLTISIFLGFFLFYLALKSSIKSILFKLYPEARRMPSLRKVSSKKKDF